MSNPEKKIVKTNSKYYYFSKSTLNNKKIIMLKKFVKLLRNLSDCINIKWKNAKIIVNTNIIFLLLVILDKILLKIIIEIKLKNICITMIELAKLKKLPSAYLIKIIKYIYNGGIKIFGKTVSPISANFGITI